ncbi:TonB-dependent receptor [Novosphingobium sp. PhB165]|uniref:TonB-dependent receptor domain-containing protein n=1 Tax=Novosphingobium sp. PhB165 TaxID=2485105 RepID=UPI001404B3A0|nr:TonB-dependent receptor [Novosphingobium sp. PhB165]
MASIAVMPTAALAQTDAPQPAPDQSAAEQVTSEPIVVIGTLIRGIAPAGNNVIDVDTDKIQSTGAASTSQVLSTIPQVGNFFNGLPAGVSQQPGANTSNPINRPNLRNLPGANTSGGAQTLVLFDGQRVVGAGIQQVAVDPDIIAPGVIQRVEAMTDGGSAVYGSDALGGVINFVTRDRFNGVQVDARYGIGEDYQSVDASAIAGKDWGSGGLYVAYGYSHHDSVFGSDRDWVKQVDWNTNIPTGRNCAEPNVTVGGRSYIPSGSGIVAGGPNVCDFSDPVAIYPTTTLHTVFARLNQHLSSNVRFDMTALYANRSIDQIGGTLGTGALGTGAAGQATLTSASPFYRPTGDVNAGLPQVVKYDYSPLYGTRSATQETDLETWRVAPSLSVELGSDWEFSGLFSYGLSTTSFSNAQISAAAQSAALAAGTLNPYDVGSTAPGVASGLLRYATGTGRNELFDYRAIVNGPVFALPGGMLRAAAGYEHMQDNFTRRTSNASTYALQDPTNYTQKVDSVFGELSIPIVSDDNAMSFLNELTLSASARYDKYNDFGDTFNPKFAATLRPVEWIAIRGNWGKSFTAPSPVDQLGVLASSVATVPAAFLRTPPGVTAGPGEIGLFVSGTAPGIQPQKATNWSIGAQIDPPFVPGLTLNASYYNIDLTGTIGRPVTGADLSDYYANFPQLYAVRPSGQELANYLTQFDPANFNFTVANPTSTSQAIITSGGTSSPVLVALDTRARNLGTAKLDGIDFSANYVLDTSFASFDASVAGNYRLSQKSQALPSLPVADDLAFNTPVFRIQGTLGTRVGGLRAQITWNHTSGYKRGTVEFGQTRVSAFDAINLFFKYDVKSKSVWASDLSFTLNVQNLFDAAPPEFRSAAGQGYDTTQGSAFSIGRIVQLGVTKKF